jgi:3-oxoacyl-[acyl-carrier protein] reductase
MHNVLVTGGSRGIGLAIAQRLPTAGYNVIAVARRESSAASCVLAASTMISTDRSR